MGAISELVSLSNRKPAVQLLVSLSIVFVAGGTLLILFTLAGMFLFDISPELMLSGELVSNGLDSGFMRYMLSVQELAVFIIPSMLVFLLSGSFLAALRKVPLPADIMLVAFAALALIPLASFLGRLNASIDISGVFPGISEWINGKEDEIEGVFDQVMTGNGPVHVFGTIVIIAVLPAIGEEFFFRGVLQAQLGRLLRSGNAAVWISAVIFSAVHLQFLGFLPRLLLGLVFGYIFLWTRNIWLPVLAHFVNNALSVIAAVVADADAVNENAVTSLANDAMRTVLPLLMLVVVLYALRHRYDQS